MKRLLEACLAAAPIAAFAWGMGDREVIREYDYPRRERVIEREKVIIREKEVKHKGSEKCKDPGHRHPRPAPAHKGDPGRHGDRRHGRGK